MNLITKMGINIFISRFGFYYVVNKSAQKLESKVTMN